RRMRRIEQLRVPFTSCTASALFERVRSSPDCSRETGVPALPVCANELNRSRRETYRASGLVLWRTAAAAASGGQVGLPRNSGREALPRRRRPQPARRPYGGGPQLLCLAASHP